MSYRRYPDDPRYRTLDPAVAEVVPGQPALYPTGYVGDRLLVSRDRDLGETVSALRDASAARDSRWSVEVEERGTSPRTDPRRRRGPVLDRAASERFTAVRISVARGATGPQPDAFALLQTARREPDGLRGVQLDHLLTLAAPPGGDPGHRPISHGTPFTGGAPISHGTSDPLTGYAVAGSGGRQPVSVTLRPPARASGGRVPRPVVAVLDTGCDAGHPWLSGVVNTGAPVDPDTDSEVHADLVGPLDGTMDPLSGHGTFVCGLVRQRCPDADILARRVTGPDGVVAESDLIDELDALGGLGVDVLNLSLGYYHELPDDPDFDSLLLDALRDLAGQGTAVVAAAGNDATDRPFFPAAFATRADVDFVVSVGALNPNRTRALFSNEGDWVTTWRVGAGLVSTMPRFDASGQPVASVAASVAGGPVRASIDPDDFHAGFGVWSGTSFAAPVLAGDLAQALWVARTGAAPGAPTPSATGLVPVVVAPVETEA